MDNLATLQWEILDRVRDRPGKWTRTFSVGSNNTQAREDRKAGKFEQAKETLLDLVHEPRTPAWIQASAWQQLALLPNPWATSREYLDKALQVCQQLNGETEREKEVDATFLRDTVC